MITLITGGIGSGKSVVARLLAVMGCSTYDCDSRAQHLMHSDASLRNRLQELLGRQAYKADGTLDRAFVSSKIFADHDLLNAVNAAVHPAVLRDIYRHEALCAPATLYVETALPQESGLDTIAGQVWNVVAPMQVRIDRVMQRSGLSEQQVRQRIAAQHEPGRVTATIVNDGATSLTEQVLKLIRHNNQQS